MKISDIEVTLVDHMGTDLSVVNAARVSFAKESQWGIEVVGMEIFEDTGEEFFHYGQVLKPGDVKLINYLAKHKHYSPFNHTFLSFRIKAPIFVARQLVKHEYMPWNEVSRRYVDDEPEIYMPEYWRQKADNVKQGSSEDRAEQMYFVENDGEWNQRPALVEFVEWYFKDAISLYKDMIKAGVCAEQARMILPQNLMTEWIWSGTLKAFHKMLTLRLDPHTQKESRIVAEKIAPVIENLFPVSYPALMNNN